MIEIGGAAGILISDRANPEILVDAADREGLVTCRVLRDLDAFAYNWLGFAPAGGEAQLLGETAADHHLLVPPQGGIEGSSLDDGDLHHLEVILGHVIEIAQVEQLFLIARQADVVATCPVHWQAIGGGYRFDLRQAAQLGHRRRDAA